MSATATSSSDPGTRTALRLIAAAIAALVAVLAWMRLTHHEPPPALPSHPAIPGTAAPAPLSASQVEHGIADAREATARDPKDATAWAMLAHSYEMLGRFDQASEAYRRLVELRPGDAQVLADFADALGVAQRGSLQGEPATLIARALAADPRHLKALVLAGKEAFERNRYDEATGFWQRALEVAPDPAVRHSIETSIAEAQALASPSAKAAPGGSAFVSGRITVADALRSRIGPDDAVFIYARRTEGSRMPIAFLRKKGSDLPLDFALDDSLAFSPAARLSQQQKVYVGVRVSRRGEVIPGSGDLEGEIGPVAVGSTRLGLVIDHARP